MSQEVLDYPNVFQRVHDQNKIDKVRDIIMQNTGLIYDYKVKDWNSYLCAYPYAQSDRYWKYVDKVRFYNWQ